MKTIAVIGLGLMGGSVAKALTKHGGYRIIGYDCDKNITQKAMADRVICSVWDGKTCLEADITLLCISPDATENFLRNDVRLLKRNTILSDICGIKRGIVRLGEEICKPLGIHFVGGHPMAGRERSGYAQSVENLFINRSYILTKTENTDLTALEMLSLFAHDIGCSDITVTSPEEHDRMIAFTSQLPHVLAGAYIKSPQSDHHKGFSAGSYHDVSRVASVDENLWSQLFLRNKDNLISEIDTLIKNLEDYKMAIQNDDRPAVSEVVKQGRILKERDIIINGSEKPHRFG